ncbi:pteridine reductase [Pseudohongiella spirulinae]|uniref:Dehydrogenase/reductase n=1 Tax=Pseudohongiella spirulinae TaxID=1249552 RepID=A0A0S2KGG2_9GAMM|nr:pteridine reductase [Pseudohongiella spirulinae]ALO47370.1 Dehydrogenase/reductase [Pseudohongiella spirulinae]
MPLMTDRVTQTPVVLVTGAARRIGAEIVRVFHENGYNVIIHYRSSESDARALQQQLNQQRADSAKLLQADLNDPVQVISLACDAVGCYGRVDALVNNASAFYATPVGSITQAHWDALMNSNARAPLFLSQALAGNLRTAQGSIVNLTDINVERGMANFTPYTMAKAALMAMTRSLAQELAPEVRVNSVSPGAILWPEHNGDPQQQAEEQARILAGIPAGKLGTERDIAETVYFIATSGSYMTGENIRVDGGRALA